MTEKHDQMDAEAIAAQISRRQFLKRVGLGAAALSGAQFLAACGAFGGSGQGSGESEANEISGSFDWKREEGTTIKLLLNKHPYTDAMLENLKSFTEMTGIKVEQDIFPEENYFDKLTVALSSGQSTYDAFMTGAYQTWQYGPPGWLEDLKPWIENDSATNSEYDWEDLYPNLRAADQWNFENGSPLGKGKQLAIPWGFESNTVAYLKPVWDKYGVKEPETLGDLIDVAQTINNKEDGMYGIATRGSRSWATIHPGFMTMYSRFGLKDFEVDGETLNPMMNTPEAVDFQDKWAMMNKEAGAPNWTSYTWYQASSDLGAGKAAMLFDADIASYFQNQPGASKMAGDIRWYPGPKGPDGSLATNLWVWSLAMNAKSKKKMAAWLFLQWATGKDHLQWGAVNADMVDPVRKSVAENSKFKDRLNKAHPTYLDTFNQVIDETAIQFTPQKKFFDATTSWASTLQNIYRGDDAKSALDGLAKSLKKEVNG